jgi:hypothetical protein
MKHDLLCDVRGTVNGYHCIVKIYEGVWYGYIAVPKKHPLFGHHHRNMELSDDLIIDHSGDGAAEFGRPDWWVFGFSLNHQVSDAGEMEALKHSIKTEIKIMTERLGPFPDNSKDYPPFSLGKCDII